MRRLITALGFGYATFAGTFLVVTAPFVVLRSGPSLGQALNLVSVAVGLGLLFCGGVLLFHATVLGSLRAALGDRLNRIHAAFLGALLMPGPFIVYIAAVRDPNEDPTTLRGWLDFWSRVPGEFLIGIAPFLLGSIVFAMAFVPKRPIRRTA